MKNDVVGINEEELKKLAFEVLVYRDDISEIFNKIDKLMYQLSDYYQGEPYVNLIQYYDKLRTNYQITKSNLKNYSNDFLKLIERVHENENYIVQMFNISADEKLRIEQNKFNARKEKLDGRST